MRSKLYPKFFILDFKFCLSSKTLWAGFQFVENTEFSNVLIYCRSNCSSWCGVNEQLICTPGIAVTWIRQRADVTMVCLAVCHLQWFLLLGVDSYLGWKTLCSNLCDLLVNAWKPGLRSKVLFVLTNPWCSSWASLIASEFLVCFRVLLSKTFL